MTLWNFLIRSTSASVTVLVRSAQETQIEISDVEAQMRGKTNASISWATNVRSDSAVYYSTETPVDLATASKATGNWFTRDHRVILRSLEPGTTYYYVVESKGLRGGSAQSEEASFSVPGESNGAPTVESFTGPATLETNAEGTWTVSASDPENGSLSYAIDWGDSGMLKSFLAFITPGDTFVQESTFTHAYANEGEYTIKVTVKDEQGKTATATATVVVDDEEEPSPEAPAISGITALVGAAGITFGWDTDVAADAAVYYSKSSPVQPGQEGTQEVKSAEVGTDHSISVDGLSAGTLYHFLLESQDAEGDVGATAEFSLTTMIK